MALAHLLEASQQQHLTGPHFHKLQYVYLYNIHQTAIGQVNVKSELGFIYQRRVLGDYLKGSPSRFS